MQAASDNPSELADEVLAAMFPIGNNKHTVIDEDHLYDTTDRSKFELKRQGSK